MAEQKIPDSLFNFFDFSSGIFTFSHHKWEFSDFNQNVTQQSWNFLHQRFWGDERVIRLGPFLDEFLVLVEFLQPIFINAGDAVLLSLHAMGRWSDNRDAHSWLGGVRKSDLSGKSFVFFWVVITETDLQLHCLHEFALFFCW